MPFGLCNAPAILEKVMKQILKELLYKVCLVYLDDIIVFRKSFEKMLLNCRKIFLRLKEVNLKINLKECIFFSEEIKYLGHVNRGDTTGPKKLSAVRN